MKNTGKDIFVLTIKLLLICAVVAAALGAVNMLTEPIIAENNQKTFEEAMREVLPQMQGTPKETDVSAFVPAQTGTTLNSLYLAEDNGVPAGYVASVTCGEGYGGDVTVMVGITPEQKVQKIKIMEMSETPGLGAKASESAFSDQYNGLNNGISVVKNGSAANSVQAISGATITSKAVTKAVNTALEAAEKEGEKLEK